MIDKDLIWNHLFLELTRLVDVAEAAAQRAHETATDDENVAENKYDTLGLEAAYLAQGQQQRLLQCQTDLSQLKALRESYQGHDRVALGSLVVCCDAADKRHYFLLAQGAGGLKVEFEAATGLIEQVLVITPQAPIGCALLGAKVDDEVMVNVGDNAITYDIITLI